MNRKQYLYESNKKVRQRKQDKGFIRWEVWIKPEWREKIINYIKDIDDELEIKD